MKDFNRTIQWQYKANDGVTSVDISRTGDRLVAGTLAKSVLCLTGEGSSLWSVELPNQVWHVRYNETGETIIVGTGSTRFWDMKGRGVFSLTKDGAMRWQAILGASVWGLSLSADGNTIAVGTSQKQLILFDGNGHKLWQQDIPGLGWNAWVWSTAVSADGELVLAGAADHKIRLLDRRGRLVAEQQTRGEVFTVDISANGAIAAAGDNQGVAYCLDGSGHLLWEEKLGDKVWQVQLNGDGSRMLIGAGQEEAHLRVYDTAGRLIWRRFVGGNVSCLSFSRDGQQIALGTYQGEIYIFDSNGEVVFKSKAKQKIRDISQSGSGDTVIAGSEDGNVYGIYLPSPEKSNPIPEIHRKSDLSFGKQLRYFRHQTTAEERTGPITQKQFADFLSDEGFVYTAVTISNWERDHTTISHTDRPLLIAIIRILHRFGGIRNRSDADKLLFTGGYRQLSEEEIEQSGLV